MTATKAYRIKGTTDECTTCEKCGRSDLKKTIVLAILDADGNEEDYTYYGSDCAARALGTKQTSVKQMADFADYERPYQIARAKEEIAVYSALDTPGKRSGFYFRHNRNAHTYMTAGQASERVLEMLAEAEKILTAARAIHPTR
jgi:predicted nucleic acid-binding Zn ribbon protein